MTTKLNNGDTLSYDDCGDLDDRDRDDLDRELHARDLCRVDTGDDYVIGWYYAADGSRLDEPVVAESQPATA